MNFIILAAGRGRRLYPLTRDCPKSLLELGDGTTLLDRQLAQAVAADCVTRVTVVTGYRSDMIEERLDAYRDAIEIVTLFNPFFDLSNALMSLWCAYHVMPADDFFISNGDNIYRDGFVQAVHAATDEGISLAVSRKDRYDDDDMKVRKEPDGSLAEVAKTVPVDEAEADSVGLAVVRGERARLHYRDTLVRMVRDPENLKAFWQESLNGVVRAGMAVSLHEVAHDAWAEVDFHPDMEAMRRAVLNNVI